MLVDEAGGQFCSKLHTFLILCDCYPKSKFRTWLKEHAVTNSYISLQNWRFLLLFVILDINFVKFQFDKFFPFHLQGFFLHLFVLTSSD